MFTVSKKVFDFQYVSVKSSGQQYTEKILSKGTKFLTSRENYDIMVPVQFYPNGADSISYESKKYVLGKEYSEFPTVSKQGYTLSCWMNAFGNSTLTSDNVEYRIRDLSAVWRESHGFKALYNDGTSFSNTTYYVLGTSISITSKTIAFWHKYLGNHSTSGEIYQLIFYLFGFGFGIYNSSNYTTLYEAVSWDAYSSTIHTDNAWHHYAVAISSSGSVSMYVDGELKFAQSRSVTAIPSGIGSSSYGLYLGGRLSGQNPINGYVAKFAIWDKVLSDSEISQEYEAGKTGNPTASGYSHFYDMTLEDGLIKDIAGDWNLTNVNNQIVEFEV